MLVVVENSNIKNLKIGNREVRNICTFFQTDNLKPETKDEIYLFHYWWFFKPATELEKIILVGVNASKH